jgi:hypothetical protein
MGGGSSYFDYLRRQQEKRQTTAIPAVAVEEKKEPAVDPVIDFKSIDSEIPTSTKIDHSPPNVLVNNIVFGMLCVAFKEACYHCYRLIKR